MAPFILACNSHYPVSSEAQLSGLLAPESGAQKGQRTSGWGLSWRSQPASTNRQPRISELGRPIGRSGQCGQWPACHPSCWSRSRRRRLTLAASSHHQSRLCLGLSLGHSNPFCPIKGSADKGSSSPAAAAARKCERPQSLELRRTEKRPKLELGGFWKLAAEFWSA